ncbi:hypothetical protein [Pelistega ratti]|nr:hypothetical protein [Pelistega ratti]
MSKLDYYLALESEGIKNLMKSRLNQSIKDTQNNIYKHITQSTLKKNIDSIIANEKTVLKADLERNANSQSMISSLKTALNEITVIEQHLILVENAQDYKIINKAYSMPKNRKAGLPYDEARQAFASHITRLSNMDKVRLSDNDKKIINARQEAIKVASDIYKEKQQKILGINVCSI